MDEKDKTTSIRTAKILKNLGYHFELIKTDAFTGYPVLRKRNSYLGFLLEDGGIEILPYVQEGKRLSLANINLKINLRNDLIKEGISYNESKLDEVRTKLQKQKLNIEGLLQEL